METVVKRVDDFQLDGTGNAAAWNVAEWLPLLPTNQQSRTDFDELSSSLTSMSSVESSLRAEGSRVVPARTGPTRPGSASGYASRAKIVYSDLGLYCLYDCADERLTCTGLKDNDELFNEDVVEAFFWPEESQHLYLEYEISPLGMELPLIIPNNGDFFGWIPWHYEGDRRVRRATAVRGGEKMPGAAVTGWSAEFFIPFKLMRGFRNVPPKPGTTWRANFYRIDYDRNEPALFAWSGGVGNNFHDFRQFGTIRFA